MSVLILAGAGARELPEWVFGNAGMRICSTTFALAGLGCVNAQCQSLRYYLLNDVLPHVRHVKPSRQCG
ncbi:MAG: hypothetical protein Q8P50_16680, partial [Bacillota bacterium]|nr:hypothetical protein [Bacillota bacterium]